MLRCRTQPLLLSTHMPENTALGAMDRADGAEAFTTSLRDSGAETLIATGSISLRYQVSGLAFQANGFGLGLGLGKLGTLGRALGRQ